MTTIIEAKFIKWIGQSNEYITNIKKQFEINNIIYMFDEYRMIYMAIHSDTQNIIIALPFILS